MGQLLQTSQEHFIKVHAINIETVSNPTMKSFYQATIQYTTLEAEQVPDCYSNTFVFSKSGNIDPSAARSATACAISSTPVPTSSL